MADNTVLPGTGEVYASDDIKGINYQRVKLVVGKEGEAVDASTENPIPTASASSESLLQDIVTELRLMRTHLETMTGEVFTEEDTDDGT